MSAGREPIWHDIECGSYAADLPIWRSLAGEHSAVLDVGAGTGRVSLDLAQAGHRVAALDADAELLTELEARARGLGVKVETATADARDFTLGRRFDLVLAPMQLVQLLGGSENRVRFLRCAAQHLEPGGIVATSLLDLTGEATDDHYDPPEPDTGEFDGWRYSSLPIGIRVLDRGREIALDRVRAATSPEGETDHESNTIRLRLVDPSTFEHELRAAGFDPLPRKIIAATDDHVGSVVCSGSLPT